MAYLFGFFLFVFGFNVGRRYEQRRVRDRFQRYFDAVGLQYNGDFVDDWRRWFSNKLLGYVGLVLFIWWSTWWVLDHWRR